MAFRGHYEHSLDAKNRLSVPARFRAALAQGLVLAKDSDPCLAAWPPEVHEQIVGQALKDANPLGSKYKQIQRYYQANAFDMSLDGGGRVTIAPDLLAHAGIDKDVMVVGVGDHLEIWDAGRWRDEQAALTQAIGQVTEDLGDPS